MDRTISFGYLLYLHGFMARVIKSILFLLLVVVLHVTVSGYSTEEELCGDSIVVPHSSSQYSLDSMQLPYFPDAELGSIGFYLQEPATSRTNRCYFSSALSMRDIAQMIAARDAILFNHWQKLSDESILFSITHPIGEYYVFALRHIII